MFLLFSVIVAFTFQQISYGSGGSCCFEVEIDKTEYMPGETIHILVQSSGNHENSNQTFLLKISDITYGPDHPDIIYQEQASLNNGRSELEYEIPQKESNRYRYLISVESTIGNDLTTFVTKKGANKIIISDVAVLNPQVKQGENLKIEAKIVDGMGNPIHYLRVTTDSEVPKENCDANEGYEAFGRDLSPTASLQPRYWPDGIINGTIPIVNTVKPGKYNLVISASADVEGFERAHDTIQYEILYNPEKPKPHSLFKPFTVDFDESKFFTEQTISVEGVTTYNSCGETLSNVPVKAEIKHYDIVAMRYLETVQSKDAVSDENGRFSFSFPPVGVKPGYFTIHLTAMYDGVEQTVGTEMPYNVKNFTISAEGKEFDVVADARYSIPLNVEFNQQEKKITADFDTSDSFKRVGLTVPHELLDGEFVIFVNGVERTDIWYSKITGFTIFGFESNTDKTHIEIIGTSAIPEFGPISGLVLVISLISVVTLGTRLRLNL